MNRSISSILTAILAVTAVPVAAQWLNVPTKGIPRTKDGKADLSAPAPRKPDGRPDLSGVWQSDLQNVRYARELNADLKQGEFPIQPWAEALTKQRRTDFDAGLSEYPPGHCLPPGVTLSDVLPIFPLKIIQEPELVVILYEVFGQFRQIFLDGRELPNDPNPTWMGYSLGRWDGDALVVGSTGFNGQTWLDNTGHPSTAALHITERFRRNDFGHLDIQITIDDPKAYTKPWTMTVKRELLADTDLLEYVCNENEKDLKHQVGK
jgi:hypothetical protein